MDVNSLLELDFDKVTPRVLESRYPVGKYLFRVEVHGAVVILLQFAMQNVTPCGFQVNYYGKRRFVRKGSMFAQETPEQALAAAVTRNLRRIQLLKEELAEAEKGTLQLEVTSVKRYQPFLLPSTIG